MMSEYEMTFFASEIVFIIIMLFGISKINSNIGRLEEIKHFRRLHIFFILQAVSQLFWVLDHSEILNFPTAIDWIVNMTYVIAFGLCMYEWLRFIAEKVRLLGQSNLSKYAIRVQSVVTIIHILIVVSSVFTKLIFYIDANGDYIRGSLFWINVVCCYSHFAWTTALIITTQRRANKIAKRQLKRLLLFSLIPVFGGVLQWIYYDIPFSEASLTLAIIFMLAGLQDAQIKTDALTGLNNYAQFERDYEKMISKANEDPFELFIADINKFKQINDTYGHLAGDQALLLVAKELKLLEQKYLSLEVYRYGGDEFVLFILREDIDDPDAFVSEVNERLSASAKESGFEFDVKFSMGHQLIRDKYIDGKKAFDAVDKMLYEAKRTSIE